MMVELFRETNRLVIQVPGSSAGPAGAWKEWHSTLEGTSQGSPGIEEPQAESTAGLEPKGWELVPKTREESVDGRKEGEGCFS